MAPVPALLITGLPGADKQNLVAALAAGCPEGARWALLDNDGGDSARALARGGLATETVSGCACCSGRVLLQTGIVRLLRRARPQLLVIAVDGAAEPEALDAVLRLHGTASGIRKVLQLCVAPPQWLGRLPAPARERLQRQMNAADGVVVRDGSAAAMLRAAGVTRVLQLDEAVRFSAAAAGGASDSASRMFS